MLTTTDQNIKPFMATYRQVLPEESVFPKLHYMEDHLVNFMRQWHVGPGILGEHGGESVHSMFNNLLSRFSGVPVAADRIAQVMRHHLLQASPSTKPPPEPKPRKK